uniref:(northern house mosquito) hypothetical protein n=1 Tax=Culex pipiens TaxID=7175 RepID=A0A8D8FCJ6_CULPI
MRSTVPLESSMPGANYLALDHHRLLRCYFRKEIRRKRGREDAARSQGDRQRELVACESQAKVHVRAVSTTKFGERRVCMRAAFTEIENHRPRTHPGTVAKQLGPKSSRRRRRTNPQAPEPTAGTRTGGVGCCQR